MTQKIDIRDERLSWPGAVSLERAANGVRPWRLPFEERGLYFESLQDCAATGAGVRLAFRTDAREIAGQIDPEQAGGRLDLAVDGEVRESVDLEGRQGFRFVQLPEGEKAIELWLPQAHVFRLRSLELEEGASLARHFDSRPKWITYGSSISHCGGAASPTQTWPAIVARGHGLDLTCLGFGGQCHLDAMIARLMRDLPADFLSMCVGINIYGGASLGPRAFRAGIIGFVKIVRERHPDAPFVLMSAIYSPPREENKNAVGFTLKAMREEVAEATEILRAHGDAHVHYVDGLDVFGPELGRLLPDDLHPNAEGYRVMGANFLEKVARGFFRA